MSADAAVIRELWPLLVVRDVQRSSHFYTSKLGFEVAGRAESEDGVFWCRLTRDGVSFMLQQGDEDHTYPDPPAPTVTLYFVCDDADRLHAEFTANGLSVPPPSHAYYGMRQLFVPDPDGYAVCFESPTEEWAG